MVADDFEFDGILASSFGLMIGDIGGGDGTETLSVGSSLNFNMVPTQHGNHWLFSNTTYDETITTTFTVINFGCKNNDLKGIDQAKQRMINRWLNRKEPCKFRPILKNDEIDTYDRIWFEGSFNQINAIYINERVIGYELTFTSTRPYALGRKIDATIRFENNGGSFEFWDVSDEVGYIYPTLTIKMLQAGDLKITNSVEPDRQTIIVGCRKDEVIKFDEFLNFNTSMIEHIIQNEFNYQFFRIANTYDNKKNVISTNLACEMRIEYIPVVKGVGI